MRLTQKLNNVTRHQQAKKTYEQVIAAIHQAASEALGQKEEEKQNKLLTWNTTLQELKEQKQEAYHRWLSSKDPIHKNSYRTLQQKFKKRA